MEFEELFDKFAKYDDTMFSMKGMADYFYREGEKKGREDDKYYELIMAVKRKWPNESRHETALRYIQEAEKPTNETAKQSGG